ncbi:aldehyde dehydrogenase [Rhodobacter sp.]
MLKLAELIERDADTLALYETLASGKPVAATVPEIRAAAIWYRYYAGLAANLEASLRPLSATAAAQVTREPLGVILAITPFNAAFSLGAWKIAPALAMGNTIVVKPPHDAAHSTLHLARLMIEAGFPPGVLNVVVGDAATGAALADDPRVAGISITGSSAAARAVGMAALSRLRHFSAEAGGKSAHIVFEDADLDNAVIAATQGVFSAAGQTCVAGSRLLIHETVHDAFVEKYLARVAGLRLGDPRLPSTHVGPLAAARHEERVSGFVTRALADGAELLLGGARPDLDAPFDGGFWFAPTVLAGTNPAMEIAREEVFGPVVVLQKFASEEEAVQIANGTEYGLAAGFWSQNPARMQRVAGQLRAGTVWVNTYRTIHWRVPFGGYKQSGVGRENGPEALLEFSQIKSVIVDTGPARDPFAY